MRFHGKTLKSLKLISVTHIRDAYQYLTENPRNLTLNFFASMALRFNFQSSNWTGLMLYNETVQQFYYKDVFLDNKACLSKIAQICDCL